MNRHIDPVEQVILGYYDALRAEHGVRPDREQPLGA